MANSPKETLKDVVLGPIGDRSDDILANALRTANKTVILTQAAYDALSPKDSNTLYIIVD